MAIKYAKIINRETKEVQLGVGVNDEYYASIGMDPMDVEQAYNGKWYVKGYAPADPVTPVQKKRNELIARLGKIDAKSARSMRAILAGTATQEDRDFLAQLEEEAEEVRKELQLLDPVTGA